MFHHSLIQKLALFIGRKLCGTIKVKDACKYRQRKLDIFSQGKNIKKEDNIKCRFLKLISFLSHTMTS